MNLAKRERNRRECILQGKSWV